MLRPIRQNAGTTPSERYLAALASNQFFALWSYPGLTRRAKKGVTKELADLTVIFGDNIVLFSDKDIAWPTHEDISVAWSRWFRASVKESAKQLWGAVAHLRGLDPTIFLDANCETPFPLPAMSANTRIHLVAVASNSVESACEYFASVGGPGSSGTLMHAFGIPEIDEGRRPFVVGDLDRKKPFVHIFDTETLDRVVHELGTISDFVHYLTTKEEAIRSGKLSAFAGEEDLLAFYLQERTPDGYGSLPFVKHPKTAGFTVHIPEGEWRLYSQSNEYRVRCRMRELARDWFDLIEPFSEAVLKGHTEEADETPLEVHELALRAAASENLSSRSRLGSAFAEKYENLPAGVRTSRSIFSMCNPGRLFTFVFAPWMQDSATYEQYRSYRLQLMQAYAQVAPIKFPGITEAIIVGAQTPDDSGSRSETMIYVKYNGEFSQEQISDAKALMEAERILTDFPTHAHRGKAAAGQTLRRYGRNELCPCGSLKKNKKCCNLYGPRYNPIYSKRTS